MGNKEQSGVTAIRTQKYFNIILQLLFICFWAFTFLWERVRKHIKSRRAGKLVSLF